jgi:spoIIIJ-associated protein
MDDRPKSVEVSARSVDEAVSEALQQLGLSRDQVEIDVIRQASRGLLGLLSEDAVVRVTAKVPPPTHLEEMPEPSAVDDEAKVAEEPRPTAVEDDVAALGSKTLQDLLGYMGLRARVSREGAPAVGSPASEVVRLNITGEGMGVLIGRRGETLRDLQYLTCLVISRQMQRWPNLVVDVEDYKARREKSLVELARRIADQVRKTAEPVQLEPMPPHERRIVHLSLRDDPDVFTESYGQDDKRRVVIIPRK